MIVSDLFLLLLFLIVGGGMWFVGVLYGRSNPFVVDAIRTVRDELVRTYKGPLVEETISVLQVLEEGLDDDAVQH